MRMAVGSDHAGFDLKADLARHLAEAGHEVVDFGTDSAAVSVDYPIYGIAVARAVAEGSAELGVCVCGTGIGISISANKVRGVRAALVHDATAPVWPGATATPTSFVSAVGRRRRLRQSMPSTPSSPLRLRVAGTHNVWPKSASTRATMD